MAMDNPSYFSLPRADNNPIQQHSSTNPFRNFLKMGIGTSSESVMSGSSSMRHHEFVSSVKDFTYEARAPANDYLIPSNHTSPRNDPNKRSFRSLLRSLSANSEDPQSIVRGEPRPSDIAPADHTAPFHVKRQGHTRNASMRSCTELKIAEFQQALLKKRNREAGNDENFHTMPLSGRRRHSTGAYLSRDKIAGKSLIKVTSVPSEVPKEAAPKVSRDGTTVVAAAPSGVATKRHPVTTLHCAESNPTSSPPPATSPSNFNSTHRKKRARCLSVKEMESIIVIACSGSPEAKLWSDYLISCFNKLMSQRARQHYKVLSMDLEELSEEAEDVNAKIKKVSSAKLQLLIMCPKFLMHVEDLSEKSSQIMRIFHQDKVLTMLLGVTDESLSDVHRNVFPSYDQWKRMEAKEQDNVFVDNFLSTAIDMLSKRVKAPTDKASFSIIPKKIKPGQNRVIALLNDPITSNDSIKISVDKKGELIPITSFKERNPYTLQFDVPDCCLEVSMLVWIKIEKNGVPCGSRQIKCESRLRELDQILRASDNPMEFMCQTLGFKTTDRDQLDNWMLAAFQRNIPAHFNLLSSTSYNPNNKNTMQSFDEYPTLLHFAAKFGLERLCWQLLECPGGEIACDIKNVRHLTPADLAQAHGFPNLSSNLRGFVQMNEFTNMYYYLKNMSEDTTDSPLPANHFKMINVENTNPWEKNNRMIKPNNTFSVNSPDSVKSDPFSDECMSNLESKHIQLRGLKTPDSPKTPASPKFVTNDWLYENDMASMTSSFHSFTSQNNVQRAIEHDYLIQPSNRRVESTPPLSRPQMIDLSSICNKNNNFELNTPLSDKTTSSLHQDFHESKESFKLETPTKKHLLNLSVTTPTGQDELAEIINDFKNNVFSISEVEKLVLDWKNRNETQQSLKEKEEQLNKMREEYDKLQKRIKEEMKRPTPFERVKKIFSKGKSKGMKNSSSDLKQNGQRPNSGLSLHSISSSSSGRLSTASGGSLGDSGTQSDNEIAGEVNTHHNKFINKHPTDNHSDRLHLEDYLIPPPPRPCATPTNVNLRIFHIKTDPLPAIPNANQVKQEYMHKPHYAMDTISEKEVPMGSENCNPDTSSEGSSLSRCVSSYQSNDHQYMNVSPAR